MGVSWKQGALIIGLIPIDPGDGDRDMGSSQPHRAKGKGVKVKETKITVLSKTIKTNKMPDISGFIRAMKDMGAKVSTKDRTIVIDLRTSRR